MSQERIAEARKSLDALEDAASELIYMADAARTLGMRELAEDLLNLAAYVKTQGGNLYKCWSDEFNNRCGDVQQGSTNMIQAALAVCDLYDDLPEE